MLLEIFLVSIVLFVGLVLYYVTLKNKREKIDFHGKHVVITGGNSGIGWELCIDSFKQGSKFTINFHYILKLIIMYIQKVSHIMIK